MNTTAAEGVAAAVEPTVGRIVHYQLSPHDVAEISDHRVRKSIGGAPVDVGQVVPAIIVSIQDRGVNLRCILDGYDFFWALKRLEGDTAGTWSWPPRV